MAKAATIKVKLVSTADTGYFYVTKKNSRTMTEKLNLKKYDPVAKKHVEFKGKPRSSKLPGRTLSKQKKPPRSRRFFRFRGRIEA